MNRLVMVWVALLTAVLCTSALAHDYKYQKKSPEERMQRMNKLLDLTPEQQTKVKDIITRRDAEMEPLFVSLSKATDKEEQREIKMEILEQHKRFRDELNTVLTEEQQKKYQEFIRSKMEQRKMHKKK
ncbi:Spy/CpxP family protein refolding chaperone [Halodesulfovibrio spirochaetisodalis]|uniref:Periplasmic heavy metal sensor n=1 Tax=Halodesulfovibrio spirochaetisodalis TaxID=1560234 RepID=A0A1B7XE01_9BACT|nr:hypothetical protein [Halodesulfovibrio spirochaetisodalis]OBQ52388.1 hypothetical protein SP90_07350 [Halodesulfovibrio spirochaetisodalis]